jgi:hypothetical protein
MRCATGLLVPFAFAMTSCSSDGDAETQTSSTPTTERRSTPSTTSPPPTAATEPSPEILLELPPPPGAEAGGQSLVVLDQPQIASWLDSALAVATNAQAGDCAVQPLMMDQEASELAVRIPDAVLAELLVNLDGALGGLSLACDSGNAALARAEAEDARAVAVAVEQRVRELSG